MGRRDGVAGQAVGVVQVDEAAARGRGQGVDLAALVGGAVGERRVEGHGVVRREQRVQLARRAAARPLAFHGDDAVDDAEARREGGVQVEQHVGEVVALLGAHVQVRLGEARDAAVGELDARR